MTDPDVMSSHNEKFLANHRVSGFGAMVVTHVPCPFCAAPNFMNLPIVSVEEEMAKEHTCSGCGRSGKALLSRSSGGVAFEFVQTGGEDAPLWMQPAPRRVDA